MRGAGAAGGGEKEEETPPNVPLSRSTHFHLRDGWCPAELQKVNQVETWLQGTESKCKPGQINKQEGANVDVEGIALREMT